MNTTANLIKYSLVPGSIGFLMCGLTIGVALLHGPPVAARWGRRWLSALALLYLSLSLPPVTLGLEQTLTRVHPPPGIPPHVPVLVVLGAGSITCRAAGGEINLLSPQSGFSVLEAARAYGQMGHPDVIASGGAPVPYLQLRSEAYVLRDALIKAGIPSARITVEERSLNTHDQAVEVARLLRPRKITRFVLVASKTHLPRAVALFRAQELEPIPLGSSLRSESGDGWDSQILPSLDALRASEMVSYHYLATAYAWGRGWLEPERN